MKEQKVQSNINLETLAGGAFTEKLNEALMQVAENIQNMNTDATAKRGITISIKFSPNKTRQIVNTQISVTTKLAATEAIDTQMIMGKNIRTGEIEIAEYDGHLPGQITLDSYEQEVEWAKAPPEPTEEAKPIGKPLDLRNRNKQPEMVAGQDFDPETGEVYETDRKPEDDRRTTAGRVVPITKNVM